MAKKKVTLSIESKVYSNFQKYCDDNAVMLSKKIEIFMENFIKHSRGKRLTYAIFAVFIAIFITGMAYAGVFSDALSGDFSGVHNRTYYNSSGFVTLNETIPGNSTNTTITANSTNATEMLGSESGLVSYWRFNESSWTGASGEVKDVLGKNNGTSKTGASTTAGIPGFGNAGNFSGTSGTYVNEVQVKHANELNPGTGGFTITGWARSYTRGGNGYQLYVAKRDNVAGGKNGFYVGLLEGSGVKFVAGDGTNRYDTAYVPITMGQWFHFAAIVDKTSNILNIYINGTINASIAISGALNISNNWNLSIGNDEGQALLGSTWQYPVMGNMDEVAIWNRTLSAAEILSLYQNGSYSAGSTVNVTNGTNATEFYSGIYESPVKDAGSIATWGNISWNEAVPYGEELLGNLQIESATGGIDMTENVLLLHLNESSGTFADSSGTGNDGTESGGVSYNNAGKFAGAAGFDGSNDYINLGNANSVRITGNITLSHWIKFNQVPSGTTAYATISKNEAGGYGIIANEQVAGGLGKLVTFFHIGGSYKNAGIELGNFTAGRWYYVAATYNGSSVDFYVDGILRDSVAATGSISDVASYGLALGANPGASYAGFFNGSIDEVAVWNRSLSSSEIANIYRRGMNLKFQIRTSSDNASWSSYLGADGSAGGNYTTSGVLINASSSRYIQYRALFERNSTNYNVKLYNVSISYESSSSGVSVSLDSPADNYLTNEYNVNVTCSASSASQLVNITPYYSKYDWGPSESARSISGTSNTTTFTLEEIASTVKWNCYACNVDGNCSFASANRTIIGDISAPTVELVSPDNENYTTSQSVSFVFNATDNRASTLSCALVVDGSNVSTNSSVIAGQSTIISYSPSNGNHSWKINCSDGINYYASELRNITVNYTSTSIIWAKAQSHSHTTNSDGNTAPAGVVSAYKNAGYNILAITDHNVVTNCTPYTNLSANFICITSEEWTPGSGAIKHVIRANISSHVATGTSTDAEVQNAFNTAQNEGGFAVAAHPNWTSTIWSTSSLIAFQNYSIMEIYNGVIERLSPDPYAVDKWDDVLKSGKKIFGTSVDDMHILGTDFNKGWAKVHMSEFSAQEYINSMLSGYFYSSQGPSMDDGEFFLVCDGGTSYHMGQTANCTEISAGATISATNSSFKVQNITLIKDGNSASIKTDCPATQNCTFTYAANLSSSGYYRLEATDSNNKQIWSNPIWVNLVIPRVNITINAPANGSTTSSHFPVINISLDRTADTLWFIHHLANQTLCTNCSSYFGYIRGISEGSKQLIVYANNSNNDVTTANSSFTVNFNKTYDENFDYNFSINTLSNAIWESGRITLDIGNTTGSVAIKSLTARSNITSIYAEWTENNTADAMGEGQINPVRLKFRFGSGAETEIANGSTATGLNSNNLTLIFYFDKKIEVPINLLGFKITWTEYTIPLMSNVSASSITSSSAVISWTTDISSNSSVYYGTTTALGQVAGVNDSTTSHSVSLSGLSSSTAYFYKVVSCSEGSCSQEPQEPFTPYSFTTQSASTGGGSGGGGGGGGGGSTIIPVVNTTTGQGIEFGIAALDITPLASIVVNPEESRKILLNVRNSGTAFLNDCKLLSGGINAAWITAEGLKDLSIGESAEFLFSLKVPKETNAGKYFVPISIICLEVNRSINLGLEVIPKKLELVLLGTEKDRDGNLLINYSLEELAGERQDTNVEFVLFGAKNSRIAELNSEVALDANAKGTFGAILELPRNSEGSLNLVINAKSKIASAFVQEYILLERSPVRGFAISGENTGSYITAAVVMVFLVFAFFAARRIFRYGGIHRRKGIVKKITDASTRHGHIHHN